MSGLTQFLEISVLILARKLLSGFNNLGPWFAQIAECAKFSNKMWPIDVHEYRILGLER